MAHNFRLTGDYYVSKEGSDSNDGLTPDTPKLTYQAVLNLITTGVTRTIIVGAGVYKEAISKSMNATNMKIRTIADGYCVFEGNGSNTFVFLNGSFTGTEYTFNGFEFRNYATVDISQRNNHNPTITLENCIIKCPFGTTSNVGNHTTLYKKCVFINASSTIKVVSSIPEIEKCIFINTLWTLDTGSTLSYRVFDSYFNSSSGVACSNNVNSNYNNNQGAFCNHAATTVTTGVYQNTAGQYYDLSLAGSGGSGTIGDPFRRDNTIRTFFALSVFKILYPTANVNSFSADPKFNNVANLNFTLQSDSPHIKTGEGGVNIGGTEYAVYVAATDDPFDADAVSVTNLSYSGNDYVIDGATTGEVVSGPISLQWPAVRPLEKIHYEGLLEFNKSITAGTSGNQQVPDQATYTTGAGANPDRLSIYLRFSTQELEPTTDGEWDNGGYYTAGTYQLFEINAKPQVDAGGLGNGDPSFVGSGSFFDIIPTWVQVKVKLINNYNP
jgi:hypothetical protein